MNTREWTRRVATMLLLSGSIASTAFAETTLPAGTAAVVNGTPISLTQLDEAVRGATGLGAQPETPQLRQALKQKLIERELVLQNAEKAGYGAKPEVAQVMNAAKVNAEMQLYLKDNLQPDPVTDAQVKARYDEFVASLGKDEYKPSIIAVSDAATAATVLAQLKAGRSFADLARQYSKLPSAAVGGQLPWVSFKTPATEGKTQGVPLAVAQALTKLSVGEVMRDSIALGDYGNGMRAIVKLDAKRPTQVPSFEQTQGAVRSQLQALAVERAEAKLTGDLMKSAKIEQ